MNNMSFMIWFSVYACAMITLGWYVSRKQKTGEDFLLVLRPWRRGGDPAGGMVIRAGT